MIRTNYYFVLMLGIVSLMSVYGQSSNLKTAALKQQLELTLKNARLAQPATLRLATENEDQLLLTVVKHLSIETKECYYGRISTSSHSSFRLAFEQNSLSGMILDREAKLGYNVYSNADGEVIVEQTDINNIICTEYEVSPAPAAVDAVPPPTSAVYKLQSNPASKSVAYLDFDGETISGTEWVNGGTITAVPGNFTETNIQDIFNLVSEDFSPFSVNVTTDVSIYNAATKTSRMRCIFTPTNTASPGAGGVAYVGSFTWGDDTPCWVFNSGVKAAGEAASHEIGHTLNLKHDGRTTPVEEYFAGHSNWGPIMGATYSRAVVQWSSGEYNYANNTQDDINIITSRNGFTFKTDDFGNTIALAGNLIIEANGSVLAANNKGIVERRTDLDVFKITSAGGTINMTASPAAAYPNLDIKLDLLDAQGTLITTSNPTTLGATLSYNLGAGTYYITVDGVGANDPKTNGYSDYASIGVYSISGTVPVTLPDNLLPNVTITAPVSGVTYEAVATVLLKANATDLDGTITKVEFFNGNNKLGEDLNAPYEYTWPNVAIGTYNITAKATDNKTGVSTSSVVVVSVKKANCKIAGTEVVRDQIIGTKGSYNNNGRDRSFVFDGDSISYFDSPINNGSWVGLELNGIYKITGIRYYPRASFGSRMNGGKFQGSNSVDFSTGVVDLATITTTPTVEWNCITISNANSFKYVRYLAPNASQGNVAEIEFYGTKTANLDPTVKITSPAHLLAAIIPATILVKISASDPDGTIAKVELYDDTLKIGEDSNAPYEFTLQSDSSKKWNLTAKAIDNVFEYTKSDIVTVFAKRQLCLLDGNLVKTFTILGTTGSYSNLGNTRDKVFDKDTTTFFDGPNASNNWVGLDLGSPKNIKGVRFFPRDNSAQRMLNGRFQIATNATFTQGLITIDTLSKIYDNEWNCVEFPKTYNNRYIRYISPSGGYCNIAELQVYLQNTAPTVSFTNSVTSYNSIPAQVILNIAVTDADGSIKALELYENGVFITNLMLVNGAVSYAKTALQTGTYIYTAKAIDDGNASTSATLTVQINSVTDINEINDIDLITIAPNPTKGSIYIQTNKEISNINLLDTKGIFILEIYGNNNEVKLPENIANGLYVLRLTLNDGQLKTFKVQVDK